MHLSKSVETFSLWTSRKRFSVVYQLASATASARRSDVPSRPVDRGQEIVAIAHPDNERSIRVAEKLGLRFVGERKVKGRTVRCYEARRKMTDDR